MNFAGLRNARALSMQSSRTKFDAVGLLWPIHRTIALVHIGKRGLPKVLVKT